MDDETNRALNRLNGSEATEKNTPLDEAQHAETTILTFCMRYKRAFLRASVVNNRIHVKLFV